MRRITPLVLLAPTRFRWRPFLVLLLASVGCDGVIGSTPPPVEEMPIEEIDVECGVGRVPARRLSRGEYNNTMRDLFTFDVGRPADAFPEDVAGVDGLTVNDLFLEKHDEAVTRLADEAIANGFITCDPAVMGDDACAREILAPFVERAWRRPVTSDELDNIMRYLDIVAAEGDEVEPFTQAIRMSIQATLMSPNFLFRWEVLDDAESEDAQALGQFDVASRLSYFIYESMPDEELFAAAEAGTLTDPEVLEAQVERMLADELGAGFLDRLLGEWLATDRIQLLNPNPAIYPDFDRRLLEDMEMETRLFAAEFLENDLSFRDMLDADFTYLNQRLATHYGLPNAAELGEEFERVSLAALPERGGLLTQGSLLTATSVPHNDSSAVVNETSVIVRGKFILDHLLCADLPALPEGLDVVAIQSDSQREIPDTAPRKVREGVRLDLAQCAACHRFIDPIGFSMEEFDILGRFRTEDQLGTTVDSSGTLLDDMGVPAGDFDGAASVGSIISDDPRVSSCLVRTVLTLAVGRGLTPADACEVERLAAESDENGNGLRSLLRSIVLSEAFTHEQGEAL